MVPCFVLYPCVKIAISSLLRLVSFIFYYFFNHGKKQNTPLITRLCTQIKHGLTLEIALNRIASKVGGTIRRWSGGRVRTIIRMQWRVSWNCHWEIVLNGLRANPKTTPMTHWWVRLIKNEVFCSHGTNQVCFSCHIKLLLLTWSVDNFNKVHNQVKQITSTAA